MKFPLFTHFFACSRTCSHFLQLPTSLLSSQTTISCQNVLSFNISNSNFWFYNRFFLLCFSEILLVSFLNSLVERNQKSPGTCSWMHSECVWRVPGMLIDMYYHIYCTDEKMRSRDIIIKIIIIVSVFLSPSHWFVCYCNYLIHTITLRGR